MVMSFQTRCLLDLWLSTRDQNMDKLPLVILFRLALIAVESVQKSTSGDMINSVKDNHYKETSDCA